MQVIWMFLELSCVPAELSRTNAAFMGVLSITTTFMIRALLVQAVVIWTDMDVFLETLLQAASGAVQWGIILLAAYSWWKGIHLRSLMACQVCTMIVYGVLMQQGTVAVILGCLFFLFPPCAQCDFEEGSLECISFQELNGCHKCSKKHCSTKNRMCLFFGRDRFQIPDAQLGDTVPHMTQTGIQFFCNGNQTEQQTVSHGWWNRGRSFC